MVSRLPAKYQKVSDERRLKANQSRVIVDKRRPCLKGRTPNKTAHSSFSKTHSPPPNPEMHGAVLFGVAAVLGGGRLSSAIGAYLVGTQYSARGACVSLAARKEFGHGI